MNLKLKAIFITIGKMLFWIFVGIITILIGIGLVLAFVFAPVFLVKHGILPKDVLNLNAGFVMIIELLCIIVLAIIIIVFVYVYKSTFEKLIERKNMN